MKHILYVTCHSAGKINKNGSSVKNIPNKSVFYSCSYSTPKSLKSMLPLESRDRSCRRSCDRGPPKSEPCCFSKPSNASKFGRELLKNKKNLIKNNIRTFKQPKSRGISMGGQWAYIPVVCCGSL